MPRKILISNWKKQIQQKLISEQAKRIAAENNLFIQRQINQSLWENNANLTQKIYTYEQNHTNLQNVYQITLKDKQTVEKQLKDYQKEKDQTEKWLKEN